MKKLFTLIFITVFFFSTIAVAEEIRSGLYEFDLSTNGSMSAGSGTSIFLIDGSSAPLDLSMVQPNLGVWSLQVYQINPGALTASASGNSPWQLSGVTYTIDYSTSIKNGIWSSGTTNIVSAMSLSGQTTEVIPFIPEFAKYYRFRVTSGITQIGTLRAKLLIQ